MDSTPVCDPDHFMGPDGAIYTMICKSSKHNFDSNNNKNNNKVKDVKGFGDGIYTELSSKGNPFSRLTDDKKQHLNGGLSAINNHDSHSHSHSNELKFTAFESANIYEVVPDLHATPPSSVSSKKMSSEEEAKLQDLLSDLLGMADNFCGKLNEKTEEVLNSEVLKDSEQVKINHPEFKNFKTASSDSGFYQQLSHDDDNNNASCIHPSSKCTYIRPSNHPSLYPSNEIYSELKLPEGNELVTKPEYNYQEPQNHFKETQQDFNAQGNGDSRKIKTSDKSTETEDDFQASTNQGPIENFYSFLSSKSIPLSDVTPTIITTTTNFRDQHQKDFNSYNNNENFSTLLPDFCFGLNGSKATTYSETPYLMNGMDGRHLADHNTTLSLLHPSETLNFTFRPKSTSNSPHDTIQTLHPMAPTCSNCNMNFEDHSRHLCCLVDDDDDDLTSLHTETIPCDMSESINSLIDVDTPHAEQLAIRLVCSSRDGRMEEKRKNARRKTQEEEVVTLEPIGTGMQVLESERQSFPNTVDNRILALPPPSQTHLHSPHPLLPPPPPLTPRCNDFFDSQFHFHKNNFSSQSSTTRHHAPLVKSASSGYHEKRSGTTGEWEDPAYYSPQPTRTDFALDLRKNPTAGYQQFHVQTNNILRQQNSTSCNNFQTSHRFRQNNINSSNSKFPLRLRQKFNNNVISTNSNSNINNNNNYINNNGFHFQHQKSPTLKAELPFSPSKDTGNFRSLRFSSHQPLKGFHSLQISGKDQLQDEAGFEELCTTMPRSMKLLSLKYHQFSEPQLFRNFPIDSSLNPLEVMTTPCFVTDQSKSWYHPNMSREQAIKLLLNKPAGSFIIRNSNSFDGAYGLVVKVDKLPQQVISATPFEYVRHFLIETTTAGVRIKGSPLEPTFGSLSTLVYQHMLTPLSLPCPLVLSKIDEDFDIKVDHNQVENVSQVVEETFFYVNGECTEGLTGQVAMTKAIDMTFNSVCITQFKVTKVKLRLDNDGMSLTDLERKLFFRKKYPWNCISYSGIDNSPKVFFAKGDDNTNIFLGRLFCIVARSNPLVPENTCHILACTKPQDHNYISIVETINDRICRTN